MANEATLKLKTSDAIDFTVADGTGIEKGALLKLTDPRTAIISSAANDMIAGIAAREKIASDGRTQLSVYREGIFDMYASGAITVGKPIVAADTGTFPNYIAQAGIAASGAQVLGYALETATNGEVIEVYVNVGCGGNHAS